MVHLEGVGVGVVSISQRLGREGWEEWVTDLHCLCPTVHSKGGRDLPIVCKGQGRRAYPLLLIPPIAREEEETLMLKWGE